MSRLFYKDRQLESKQALKRDKEIQKVKLEKKITTRGKER
jgi:hypothetical protein